MLIKDTWAKNIYDNTLTQYKAICTKWFLGTGGGDGRTSMFENWDNAKYETYGVDKNTYDHHDISKQPTVLINSHHNI